VEQELFAERLVPLQPQRFIWGRMSLVGVVGVAVAQRER
jgi:hypothetical protein